MDIKEITDQSFSKYGKVIDTIDFTGIIRKMQNIPLPDHVIYEPSADSLECFPIKEILQNKVFGEIPIQIGYCIGRNKFLNALEYHKASEVNIAAEDMVLLLGCRQDITEDFHYDTSKVEAFILRKGSAVEIYATTLHYAPCSLNGKGFRCVVVLPAGTNYPLERKYPCGESTLLTAKNKWLIVHKDGGQDQDAFIGLTGDNVRID